MPTPAAGPSQAQRPYSTTGLYTSPDYPEDLVPTAHMPDYGAMGEQIGAHAESHVTIHTGHMH